MNTVENKNQTMYPKHNRKKFTSSKLTSTPELNVDTGLLSSYSKYFPNYINQQSDPEAEK